MDGTFRLEVHPEHLHLKFPSGFVLSAESTAEVWVAVAELSGQRGPRRVLIDLPEPDWQLDTMAAFESGRMLAEYTAGLSIAICLYDRDVDELPVFFKTVAQNRGVKVEFFPDLASAHHWLDVDAGENAAGS